MVEVVVVGRIKGARGERRMINIPSERRCLPWRNLRRVLYLPRRQSCLTPSPALKMHLRCDAVIMTTVSPLRSLTKNGNRQRARYSFSACHTISTLSLFLLVLSGKRAHDGRKTLSLSSRGPTDLHAKGKEKGATHYFRMFVQVFLLISFVVFYSQKEE